MEAALGEMYNNSDKKKYMCNPFVVLKQEDVLNVYSSTTTSSASSDIYPMNKINL